MYLVRKGFRSYGKMFRMGSVVSDPSKIRFFNTKLKNKQIVELTKDNYKQLAEYVRIRTGQNPVKRYEELLGLNKPKKKPTKTKAKE